MKYTITYNILMTKSTDKNWMWTWICIFITVHITKPILASLRTIHNKRGFKPACCIIHELFYILLMRLTSFTASSIHREN